MDKERLLTLVRNPQGVSIGDLPDLELLVMDYPFFQAAHLFIAKATENHEDIIKAATYTTNRSVLSKIVNSEFNPEANLPSLDIEIGTDDLNAFDKLSSLDEQLSDTHAEIDYWHQTESHWLYDEKESSNLEDFWEETSQDWQHGHELIEHDYWHETHNDWQHESPEANHHQALVSKEPEISNEWLTHDVTQNQEVSSATQEDDGISEAMLVERMRNLRKLREDMMQEDSSVSASSSWSVEPAETLRVEQIQEEEDDFLSPSLFSLNELVTPHKAPHFVTDIEDLKDKQGELIDHFIKKGGAIKITEAHQTTETDLASESAYQLKVSATETLAEIMVRQGKNQKAVEIYEQLILKYPEKSTYFASQIEKLQKQI